MKNIPKNKDIYYVGYIDEDEFWSIYETEDETHAIAKAKYKSEESDLTWCVYRRVAQYERVAVFG